MLKTYKPPVYDYVPSPDQSTAACAHHPVIVVGAGPVGQARYIEGTALGDLDGEVSKLLALAFDVAADLALKPGGCLVPRVEDADPGLLPGCCIDFKTFTKVEQNKCIMMVI